MKSFWGSQMVKTLFHKPTTTYFLAYACRVLTFFIAALVIFATLTEAARVRGYFRKDGTYVRPHYRTNPDGNPFNNYSFPGNYNPNTGTITGGDPAKYLERYYQRQSGGVPSTGPASSSILPMLPYLQQPQLDLNHIEKLTPLPDAIPANEIERSFQYCDRIFQRPDGNQRCKDQQSRALASILLPDYSNVNASELARSAGYCERIYGDNRASFYHCFNSQIFRLKQPGTKFEGIEESEVVRSRRYCERIYGDNRGSVADCLRSQERELKGPALDVSDIPTIEWQRSTQYCERIYGDNRASVKRCLRSQAYSLRRHLGVVGSISDPQRDAYCERLYGNNRSGYWSCVSRR